MIYDKRYQVFVSSTFADLKEERQNVMQVLLEADCIPAGMELFPASGELWELIQKVIEESDYYVVILAGRYGSVTAEGISYTEKEFDHAVSVGKPILAFLHEKPDEIPAGKFELEATARSKLGSFWEKVERGRVCKYWTNPDDLGGKVSRSINQAIKRQPTEGWIQGRYAANEGLIAELMNLRAENDRLSSAVPISDATPPEDTNEFASGSDVYELHGTFEVGDEKISVDWVISIEWKRIFEIFGPLLFVSTDEQQIRAGLTQAIRNKYLNDILSEYKDIDVKDLKSMSINEPDFSQIKIQFLALGLIARKERRDLDGTTRLYWTLTPYGEIKLIKESAIRKSNT